MALAHYAQLCAVGLDPELWRLTTIELQTEEDMLNYIRAALQAQAEGTALPFVIVEERTGGVIGTTRYQNANHEHLRVEIGFSWVAVGWQRTAVNTEAKYLLLRHAFEQLRCVRVEFKADSQNERSCRALLRIGARQEGVMRNYILSRHKSMRDLSLFSIIDSEWPAVKADLRQKLYRGEPT
jgi:RimJ/RimL family protein N-acetyltransferase